MVLDYRTIIIFFLVLLLHSCKVAEGEEIIDFNDVEIIDYRNKNLEITCDFKENLVTSTLENLNEVKWDKCIYKNSYITCTSNLNGINTLRIGLPFILKKVLGKYRVDYTMVMNKFPGKKTEFKGRQELIIDSREYPYKVYLCNFQSYVTLPPDGKNRAFIWSSTFYLEEGL